MTVTDVLRRAASLMSSERAYSRNARDAACLVVTDCWSATGALERSARPLRSGSMFLGAPDMAALDEAKNAVCRFLGFPHIDTWEAIQRPRWDDVRDVFREAA